MQQESEKKNPLELSVLPLEVLFMVADHLNARDTLSFTQSCRYTYFSAPPTSLLLIAKQKKYHELFHRLSITGTDEASYYLAESTIYAAGSNTLGQLGLANHKNPTISGAIDVSHLNLDPNDKIKTVVSTKGHSCFLTETGRVFAWGCNANQQLGLINDKSNKLNPVEILFQTLNLDTQDKIVSIALGELHSIFLTKKGRLFACGSNCFGQLGQGNRDIIDATVEIDLLSLGITAPDEIDQLVSGELHTFLRTKSGEIFAWGNNTFGQLGFEDIIDRLKPAKLNLKKFNLQDDRIFQIQLGAHHSCLLTQSGRIFFCGKNDHQQLGLDNIEESLILIEFDKRRLNLSARDKIIQIQASEDTSCFLTKTGRIFILNDKYLNQPKSNNKKNMKKPYEIDIKQLNLAQNDKVKEVTLNGTSIFLRTATGRVFVMGENLFGQLGLNHTNDVSLPTEIFHAFLKHHQKLISHLFRQISIDQSLQSSQSTLFSISTLLTTEKIEASTASLLSTPGIGFHHTASIPPKGEEKQTENGIKHKESLHLTNEAKLLH